MDPASLLLQEAAQLLGASSPRSLAAPAQSIFVANNDAGFAAMRTNVPSPSTMRAVSALHESSNHISPAAAARSASTQQPPNAAINAIAHAMVHDAAATQELIGLLDAMHDAEYAKLAEARRLLEEEKRIRVAYMEQLQEQAEELQSQRRKLIATAMAAAQAAPQSPTKDNDDTASVRSGGQQLQQQQQQGAASLNGSHQNFLRSQQLQQLANYAGSAAGAGGYVANKAPSVQFGGGQNNGSVVNAPQSRQNMPMPQAASQQSAIALQRKLVASIPGVSFGALTTAACASRYAQHWAKESEDTAM